MEISERITFMKSKILGALQMSGFKMSGLIPPD